MTFLPDCQSKRTPIDFARLTGLWLGQLKVRPSRLGGNYKSDLMEGITFLGGTKTLPSTESDSEGTKGKTRIES